MSQCRAALSIFLISSLFFSNPSPAFDRLTYAKLAAASTTLTGIFAGYVTFDALLRSIQLTHMGENAYDLADSQRTSANCGADDTSVECMPYVAREHARGLKAAAGWTATTIATTFFTGVSFLFSRHFLRLNTWHHEWIAEANNRCHSCGSFDLLFHVPIAFGIVAISSALFNVFYWSGLLTRHDYGATWKTKWPELVDSWENMKYESNYIITEAVIASTVYVANWAILKYALLRPNESTQILAEREAARQLRIAANLAAVAAAVARRQNQGQNAINNIPTPGPGVFGAGPVGPVLAPAQVSIEIQGPAAAARGGLIGLRSQSIEQFSRAASVGAGLQPLTYGDLENSVTFHPDDSAELKGESKSIDEQEEPEGNEENRCPICFDPYTADNPRAAYARFTCGHMNVHGSCIDQSMAFDVQGNRDPRCFKCRDTNQAGAPGR